IPQSFDDFFRGLKYLLWIAKGMMDNLGKKKVGTALTIIPPVIFLIAVGPPAVLLGMVLMATFLGLREFYALCLPHSFQIERWAGIGLGLIFSLMVLFGNPKMGSLFLVFLLFFLSLLFMMTSKDLSSTISNLGISLFGIFYVGFLLSHVSLVRYGVNGRIWVLFMIATVWAGDISAYWIGSLLGRHRLYPKISPKKTYEGLGGAIGGSVLTALVFSKIFLPELKTAFTLFLAIGMGILGQAGDFIESMLKRSAQVKDSGSFIPGHGGMLDRLDSFLFSAPFLHYSLLYLLKGTP
ncbi:MAG: phosphatidate cytidylyltransferase, partial [Thermodesulfobacteriota bacterium]